MFDNQILSLFDVLAQGWHLPYITEVVVASKILCISTTLNKRTIYNMEFSYHNYNLTITSFVIQVKYVIVNVR